MTNNIKYSGGRISRLDSLASLLGLSLNDLDRLSENVHLHYKIIEINKKNSTDKREIHVPSKYIKKILRRINSRIFSNVEFPDYLYGSIPDKNNPRDYIKCAALHCRATVLIKIDIKDFFPSITLDQVKHIFTVFFRFSDDVSEVLARLTTCNGYVPQGAPTSSFIANLCFFDSEPSLVAHLKNQGFNYSRLIDDITISRIGNDVSWKYIQSRVTTVIESKGFTINQDKTKSISNGNSQSFKVHGLCINDEFPRFSKSHVDQIKKSVNRLVKKGMAGQENRKEKEFHRLFYSVQGKTTKLKRVKHPVYPALKKAINKYALPLPDSKESTRLAVAIKNLERDYPTLKDRESYKNRYFKVRFRVGILSRVYKKDAELFKKRLLLIKPEINE